MAREIDRGHLAAPAYRLVRSRRRTIAVIVRPDQSVEVRCPPGMPRSQVDRFVRDRLDWIRARQKESRSLVPLAPVPPSGRPQADQLIRERIGLLAQQFILPVPRVIRIRDMVSRWGSCSAQGAISINRRCALLPADLLDYVILHEFCHLRHLHHGTVFWQALQQQLPDVQNRRRHLKQYYPAAGAEEESHLCQNNIRSLSQRETQSRTSRQMK